MSGGWLFVTSISSLCRGDLPFAEISLQHCFAGSSRIREGEYIKLR